MILRMSEMCWCWEISVVSAFDADIPRLSVVCRIERVNVAHKAVHRDSRYIWCIAKPDVLAYHSSLREVAHLFLLASHKVNVLHRASTAIDFNEFRKVAFKDVKGIGDDKNIVCEGAIRKLSFDIATMDR
jgi:hypothetical protein